MKEMCFETNQGIWRVVFAFDQKRKAMVLVAGDKQGKNQKKFYSTLIKIADKRFDNHLYKK